jgi:rSAM/selenodomain-associated transferase 1
VPEHRRLTAIFAKQPEPGRVKTRLSPPLSPEQAAELALAMLEDVVERCRACPGFETALRYSPAEARGWFRRRFPEVRDQALQRGRALAERLADYFEVEAGHAGRTAVALGSDCPLLDVREVERAHALLEDGADLVLGPDDGGGYWLVGLARPCAELFAPVAAGGAGVCAATLALARARGLAVELLPAGYDVDVERDLLRLRADLGRDLAARPRRTAELLGALFPDEAR